MRDSDDDRGVTHMVFKFCNIISVPISFKYFATIVVTYPMKRIL